MLKEKYTFVYYVMFCFRYKKSSIVLRHLLSDRVFRTGIQIHECTNNCSLLKISPPCKVFTRRKKEMERNKPDTLMILPLCITTNTLEGEEVLRARVL